MWSSGLEELDRRVNLFPYEIKFLNMLLDINFGPLDKNFEYKYSYNDINITVYFSQLYCTGNNTYFGCLRPVEFWDMNLSDSIEIAEPMRVLIPPTTMPEKLI